MEILEMFYWCRSSKLHLLFRTTITKAFYDAVRGVLTDSFFQFAQPLS